MTRQLIYKTSRCEIVSLTTRSHWHIDHVGDPSTFPDTPEIVVGPGAKEAILPTYPENEDSQFHEKMMK